MSAITVKQLVPANYTPSPISAAARQSPPIDLDIPYDAAWLKGKTILITGGASGFGAMFVKTWAAAGAVVIFGDVNVATGDSLARDTRKETGNQHVHFIHCDVLDWQSQVNFFKEAIKLSPHHGIDIVLPNAGIGGIDTFEEPVGLDAAEPPKPVFKTLEVNLIGVMYTVHLAFFYLPRNPGSKDCSPSTNPSTTPRDRCIILTGSMASLFPIPGSPQYGVSKHGVLGLFRCLRVTSFTKGVRVNLIAPYFIETPIVPAAARVLLAGGATGKIEDVVDAATRLAADSRISGRALLIGPKVQVVEDESGQMHVAAKPVPGEKYRAVWEAYADDLDDSDLFAKNITRILNQVTLVRGWVGWATDMGKALAYGLGLGPGNKR